MYRCFLDRSVRRKVRPFGAHLASYALLAVIALLAACQVGASDEHTLCAIKDDCNPNRYCVAGQCRDHPAESTDGDGGGDSPDARSLDVSSDSGGLGSDTPARPAHLSGTTTHDFGSVGVDHQSAPASWEIANDGDVATDVLLLDNTSQGELIVVGNDCPMVLGAQEHCSITIIAQPLEIGSRIRTLTLGSSQGGTLIFSGTLMGRLPPGLRLTAANEATALFDFGDVLIGDAIDRTFLLQNFGDESAIAVEVDLLAPAGPGFSIRSGMDSDCGAQVAVLSAGATCTIRVRFAPQMIGDDNSTLGVRSMIGGSPTIDLTGRGHEVAVPASLAGDSAADFGTVDVSVTAPKVAHWTVRNIGDFPTGTLSLTNNDPAEVVVVSDDCNGPLDPGATCTIDLGFDASVCGSRTALLTLAGEPGGPVTFMATALGRCRVSLKKAGTGIGIASSSPAFLYCDETCSEVSALALPGTVVTLAATTSNGSNSFFTGWSRPDCGSGASCNVTVSSDTTVTATFSNLEHNLVFVSSGNWPADRESAMAYDAICNSNATLAGINDAAGGAYVAFVSDASSNVADRLGDARGWIRKDGKPIADTLASLFASHALFNPVRFDASGNDLARGMGRGVPYLTGIRSDGTLATSQDCIDWTSTTPSELLVGTSEGGPLAWTGVVYNLLNPGACGRSYGVLCMGRTQTNPLAPTRTAGRRIWISNTPFIVGGALTPDAKCQSERPLGVGRAAALIAHPTEPASVVLDSTANYVRPDGTFVGTGEQIAGGGRLESGIWQSADGTYRAGRIWVGQTLPAMAGTIGSTCSDWTDPTLGAGNLAESAETAPWSMSSTSLCNIGSASVYCVETAPE